MTSLLSIMLLEVQQIITGKRWFAEGLKYPENSQVGQDLLCFVLHQPTLVTPQAVELHAAKINFFLSTNTRQSILRKLIISFFTESPQKSGIVMI
jgi:hypothetical protein